MGGGGPSTKITVSVSGEGTEFKQDSFPAGTSVRQVLKQFTISSEGIEVTMGEEKVELDAMLASDCNLVVKKV